MEVRTSVNPVLSTDLMRAILGSFLAVPGAELFDTPLVHLIKDENLVITPDISQTELDDAEADFTDYAAKALTLVQPVNVGGETEGAVGTVNWTIAEAGAVTGNTVYGYWIDAGGDWLVAEMFGEDEEVNMAVDADQLILNVIVPVAARPLETVE